MRYDHPSETPVDCRGGFTHPRGAFSANLLVAELPADAQSMLLAKCARTMLHRGQIIREAGVPLRAAYFPETMLASLMIRDSGAGYQEVKLLGRCDFVGWAALFGAAVSPIRCVVQTRGVALEIDAAALRDILGRSPAIREVLLHYIHCQTIELARSAVCNRSHSLPQRLARYLLQARDKLASDQIPLTHVSVSRGLGVRRAGVTTALGRLEAERLVVNTRGMIHVLDPDALAQVACSCYRPLRIACEEPGSQKGAAHPLSGMSEQIAGAWSEPRHSEGEPIFRRSRPSASRCSIT